MLFVFLLLPLMLVNKDHHRKKTENDWKKDTAT